MSSSLIKAGSLVLINAQQIGCSRIFGVVTEVNHQENKFLVMVISPTSSGKPISFGQERLAVVGQMQESDAKRSDAKDIALVAITRTVIALTKQLLEQDQEIRDLRR